MKRHIKHSFQLNKSFMPHFVETESMHQSELMISIQLKDHSSTLLGIQLLLNSFPWIKRQKSTDWVWCNFLKHTSLKNTFTWLETVQFILWFWIIKIESFRYHQSSTLTILKFQLTQRMFSLKLQLWADQKLWHAWILLFGLSQNIVQIHSKLNL